MKTFLFDIYEDIYNSLASSDLPQVIFVFKIISLIISGVLLITAIVLIRQIIKNR